MVEKILSAYNLLHHELDIIPFGNGLINTTWRIKNSHDDYILQKINEDVFKHPEAIAYNVKIIGDYLSASYPEYLFIRSIRTKNKEEMVHEKSGGYFRLSHYVNRSHAIDTVAKPLQAYEAAKQFGKFTKLLSGFDSNKLKATLPHFHDLSLRYRQFKDALHHGNKQRILASKNIIDYIIHHKDIADTYEQILNDPSFKLRVTHHDTKISNVLFNEEDKGLCVIDLDTVMPGYFISDVGDMLRTYLSPASEEERDFSKITIRDDYFTAIWNGYMSEMNESLTAAEKNHFIYAGKFMIYMQSMRFLTDYLNDDVYYGAKYDDHNYVRACNQAELLKALLGKESALEKLIS